MCGGFTCSKNALIALNILYVMVGFLLISVGIYARSASIVTNLPIVGAILSILAILGLAGAVKHHQVMLFFFSIGSSCLSVNSEQQKELAQQEWNRVPNETRMKVQNTFSCCGFNETSIIQDKDTSCEAVNKECCKNSNDDNCHCPPCGQLLEDKINYAFKLCGGLGIFFSFTEFIGVWLTVRYRNQKDPRGLPSAFL